MADRIRFHLDEDVDPDVARGLRRHGVDVTTTVEAGLRTRDDDAQLAYARRESRVLVTHAPGFLRFAGIASIILESPFPGRVAELSVRSSGRLS